MDNPRRELIANRWNVFLADSSAKSNSGRVGVGSEIDPVTLARLKDERLRDQLVQSLLDGTVHSIIESLKELQTIQEHQLWQQREEDIAKLKRNGEMANEEALRQIDLRILERMDQIANEQQSTLICAGLPLFKSTDDQADLRVQIALIQFILSLGPIFKDK